MCEVILTRGLSAQIDEVDLEEISARKWYAAACGADGRHYAAARIDGSIVYMHRIITRAGEGQYVDHINGDTLDNRRANLRLCSSAENLANCRLSVTNKSGFKGVYYSRQRRKWIAQRRIDKRSVNLGGFDTAREAALAYDRAALASAGEFALTNRKLGLLS